MEIHLAQVIATLVNFIILGGLIGGIIFLSKRFSEDRKVKLSHDKAVEEKLDRVLEKLEKEKKN